MVGTVQGNREAVLNQRRIEGRADWGRSHVNRLARLDELLVEPDVAANGMYPNTRRCICSIMDMREEDGVRNFKLKFRGRNGFKRVEEQDVPPLVVSAYMDIVKDQDGDED
jgi:hypothetical protein